jgi:hypothetical protein
VLLSNIKQFRAIYPEYKTASDEAVARKLNQTFFPNMKYEPEFAFWHSDAGEYTPIGRQSSPFGPPSPPALTGTLGTTFARLR